MGFLIRWARRGMLLALAAAALHSCGNTEVYYDDEAPELGQRSSAALAGRH